MRGQTRAMAPVKEAGLDAAKADRKSASLLRRRHDRHVKEATDETVNEVSSGFEWD